MSGYLKRHKFVMWFKKIKFQIQTGQKKGCPA